MFGRGQAYNDEIAISDKDYNDIKEAGFSKDGLAKISEIANYPEITTKMSENKNIVENELRVKGIPTMLSRHKRASPAVFLHRRTLRRRKPRRSKKPM